MTRLAALFATAFILSSAASPAAMAQSSGANLYMLAYVFNGANGSSTNVTPTLVGHFDSLDECSKNHTSDAIKKVPGPAVEAMTVSFICVEAGSLPAPK